jgi:hypothetical protein
VRPSRGRYQGIVVTVAGAKKSVPVFRALSLRKTWRPGQALRTPYVHTQHGLNAIKSAKRMDTQGATAMAGTRGTVDRRCASNLALDVDNDPIDVAATILHHQPFAPRGTWNHVCAPSTCAHVVPCAQALVRAASCHARTGHIVSVHVYGDQAVELSSSAWLHA